MDMPTFKIIDVPSEEHGKVQAIKRLDRKLVLVCDSNFNGKYKEGIIFTSGDQEGAYILFDPMSDKKLTLEYKNLMGLLARETQ